MILKIFINLIDAFLGTLTKILSKINDVSDKLETDYQTDLSSFLIAVTSISYIVFIVSLFVLGKFFDFEKSERNVMAFVFYFFTLYVSSWIKMPKGKLIEDGSWSYEKISFFYKLRLSLRFVILQFLSTILLILFMLFLGAMASKPGV